MNKTDQINFLLNEMYNDYEEKIKSLTDINKKLHNIVDDLKKENEKLSKTITDQSKDHADFKKVSFVQTLNKELSEKNNYISILESQLEKLKSKTKEPIEVVKDKTVESVKVEPIVEAMKEKTVESVEVDPETFEEINGYELIAYKKKYYLRDMETSEIYDINVDNKPNKVVGLLVNNKIKFNK